MTFTVRDTQARLHALGFDAGPIDGLRGPKTRKALSKALRARGGHSTADLFHHSGLHGIVWHWTAGAYGIIDLELNAYNGLLDREGNRIDGHHDFECQSPFFRGRPAYHTKRAWKGRMGLSCDAMHDAKERPFDWGSAPLTEPQVWEMCEWSAELGRAYDIPITKWSMLSHAEVERTLGYPQRKKWDITVLPGMDHVDDPIKIGDRLRGMTMEKAQDLRLAA